jgi:membrane protease YdiL (CAAX protease family)
VTAVGSEFSRATWLALASVLVWLAAAWSAAQLGIWTAMGGAAILLGAAVVLLDRRGSTALLRPSPRLVLMGAAAGGAMAVATHVIYPWLSRDVPLVATETARLYAAFRAPSRGVAALLLAPIVLGEELVWRGAVQTALARRLGAWGSVVPAAVLYALGHAPIGSPLLVAVALGCGLVWSALRAATESLVPGLTAHLLWDVLVLLWFPLDSP